MCMFAFLKNILAIFLNVLSYCSWGSARGVFYGVCIQSGSST